MEGEVVRGRVRIIAVTVLVVGPLQVKSASADVGDSTEDRKNESRDAAAERSDFEVDLHARERGDATDPRPADAEAVPSRLPRDAQGREYRCTERVVSDENEQNARWYDYPGALDNPTQAKPTNGQLIHRSCTYVDTTIVDNPPVQVGYLWIPDSMPDLTPYIQEATSQLRGVEPLITVWPADIFVVGIPTRFRVENFTTQRASTGTDTIRVWARAEPFQAVWNLNGTTFTCPFAGRPLGPDPDDDAAPEACKHTFHQSTRGATATGSVEVHYHVVWGSNLTAGAQPLDDIRSVPHTFTFQVRGYQAVIR
jgi:hypothetical protein